MFEIKQEVGPNSPNNRTDVIVVRLLLNNWIAAKRLSKFTKLLNETAPADEDLFNAIMAFQREVAKATTPNKTLQPGSLMFKRLANPNTGPGPYFPLLKVPGPNDIWTRAKRYFGAPREEEGGGTRAHAGCDLICKQFDSVCAVAEGTVLGIENFYYHKVVVKGADGKPELGEDGKKKTKVLWQAPCVNIDHGTYVVRYGEIEVGSCVVKKGDRVLPGEFIAQVSKTKMLHFEKYRGDRTGPFRVNGILGLYWNKIIKKTTPYKGDERDKLWPFHRRGDLQDPNDFLQECKKNLPKEFRRTIQ